jgi:4'-phosphopantetheinyl transferase
MFKVVLFRVIPDLTQAECEGLFSFVSLEKQERVKRFSFFEAMRNSLLGDVLARIELCRVTGLSNNELEFDVNPYGKPFLVNTSGVHYNISHAGNYIACVVSDVPVGVDVELVRPVDVGVVERFFASDEQAYVLLSKDEVQSERFFEVWTKKESRLKCEGKSLLEFLSSFSVLNSSELSRVFYHCISNSGELVGYVCSSKKESPSIRVIDTFRLLQYARLLK